MIAKEAAKSIRRKALCVLTVQLLVNYMSHNITIRGILPSNPLFYNSKPYSSAIDLVVLGVIFLFKDVSGWELWKVLSTTDWNKEFRDSVELSS
jgi:hypothetical protein